VIGTIAAVYTFVTGFIDLAWAVEVALLVNKLMEDLAR
jgi:hypothetical protein